MRMKSKNQIFPIFSLSFFYCVLILAILTDIITAQHSDASKPTQTASFRGGGGGGATPPPAISGSALESAVRVVRFRIDYPQAELESAAQLANWPTIMRKSVLASLRFVNKHWLICGDEPGTPDKTSNDCGKLQVTGERVGTTGYRLNATFIANRDPIRNAKVDATSTVFGVVQIGLRGGIFQYTNAMKLLGKPRHELEFEEAFFCYPDFQLVDGDKCQRSSRAQRSASGARHRRKHRRHSQKSA